MASAHEPIVELAPREKVSFIDLDGKSADHDRFLDLLRKTWLQIPAADRKLILDHYIKSRDGQLPKILLGSRKQELGPLAECHPLYHCLWVDSSRIFALPGGDLWAMMAIAHQLAHALLYATGAPSHQAFRPEAPLDEETWERSRRAAAREVVSCWGIDLAVHDAALEWIRRTDSGRL